MLKVMLMLVTGLLLMTACGGDGDESTREVEANGKVLHLRGQNITEDNYRQYLRTEALKNPPLLAALCNPLRGLSPAEAARTLQAATGNAAPVLWTNATPVPGQADNQEDYVTATGILLEECARVTR